MGHAIARESLRIIHRPIGNEARLVPGHREGISHQGVFNCSSAGTLVERNTRFVVLFKVNGNGAKALPDSFPRQMNRLPPRRSRTCDGGDGMAWRSGRIRPDRSGLIRRGGVAQCVQNLAQFGERRQHPGKA